MTQNSIEAYSIGSDSLQRSPVVEPFTEPAQNLDARDWIKAGDLALSPGLRQAMYRNIEIKLTAAEFNILEHLLRFRASVVTREQLVQAALGRELGVLDRSVDVHISRLRKKLAQCGADQVSIKSVRGSGYTYTAFRSNEDQSPHLP